MNSRDVSSSSSSSSNFSAPSFSGIQIRRRDQNEDTLVMLNLGGGAVGWAFALPEFEK